ncbi:MAG: protoporphyrinogen oxidase [Rhodospirillales bacterium]|nr:protoporphyrinogen oxidase [Rhodospirillales bacterium]
MLDVAVIGGGISGMTAAYSLRRRGYRVLVLERQAHIGGNAVSERREGFLMEHGPSTISADSPVAVEFSRELGLEGQRYNLGDGVRRRYLVSRGSLHGISTHPLGFLYSDYLSLGARLRLMAEMVVPRRRAMEPGEETVATFCARRFGAEFATRVIDPMVGGIYAARASEVSVAALFPKLVDLERRHGSVSGGILHRSRRGGTMPGSRLFSWRDGIGALPHALAVRLGEVVRTGVAVRRIEQRRGVFRLDLGKVGYLDARAVAIATQPHVVAQMLEGIDESAAAAAAGIDAPPLAVVFFGFRRQDVDHPLDGLGFLAAEDERRTLNGAQFCSTMFPGRAPQGSVALAAYFGGARAPDIARAPARELLDLAHREFRDLIGARGQPIVAMVRHWPMGLPQYRLGHRDRTTVLLETSQRHPGLFVTGNYFSGPSVVACVAQAMEIAARIHRFLGGQENAFISSPNWFGECQLVANGSEINLSKDRASA